MSRQGLSPHVRGNLQQGHAEVVGLGSIPARAGEPHPTPQTTWSDWVYPRTCGGTFCNLYFLYWKQGLSPHVRGNQADHLRVVRPFGSIPARAGEPSGSTGPGWRYRVYPRTCGGTAERFPAAFTRSGLSPHVRGNHLLHCAERHCLGSIPARAGEPTCRSRRRSTNGVYPRTCGGTETLKSLTGNDPGLSPHVRGNPLVLTL